ncbi:MAG: hypothetical protein J5I98_07480 [Phaeodactylibacter sp.]|nr:hypothetical protein [Phaeodactylibacter sp.]
MTIQKMKGPGILLLTLMMALGCSNEALEEPMATTEEPSSPELFEVVITQDYIENYFTLKALILSDQDGNKLLESSLADIYANEDLRLEVEKTADQILSLTFVHEFPGDTMQTPARFHNLTFYNVENGAVIDRRPRNYLGTGLIRNFEIKVAGVSELDYFQRNNLYQREYEASVENDTLTISFLRFAAEDVFFIVKIDGEEEPMYFYSKTREDEITIEKQGLKTGLDEIAIQMPESDYWSGSVRAITSGENDYVFLYGMEPGSGSLTEQDEVRFLVPSEIGFSKVNVDVTGKTTNIRYNDTFQDFPSSFDNYEFSIEEAIAGEDFQFEVLSPADIFEIKYIYRPSDELMTSAASVWVFTGLADGQTAFTVPVVNNEILPEPIRPGISFMPDFYEITLYQFNNFDEGGYRASPGEFHGLYNTLEVNGGFRSVDQNGQF